MLTLENIFSHFSDLSTAQKEEVKRLFQENAKIRKEISIVTSPILKACATITTMLTGITATSLANEAFIENPISPIKSGVFLYFLTLGANIVGSSLADNWLRQYQADMTFVGTQLGLNKYQNNEYDKFLTHLKEENRLLKEWHNAAQRDSLMWQLIQPTMNLVSRFLPTFGLFTKMRDQVRAYAAAGPAAARFFEEQLNTMDFTRNSRAANAFRTFISNPERFIQRQQPANQSRLHFH